MNKELFGKLKEEVLYLIILFFLGIVIFKILFFKENLMVIIRTVAAFFWMTTLPGFALMYYWHDKIEFVERFVIGTMVGFALVGIISYYLGILGFHLKYHGIIIPLVLLIIAIIVLVKQK